MTPEPTSTLGPSLRPEGIVQRNPPPSDCGATAQPYLELEQPIDELRSFRYVLPWVKSLAVLDLGCACGTYLRHFAPGSVGLDVSRPNVERCRQSGLQVVPADLNQELPFADYSFPAVFCSHVLEHVDAPIVLLRECCRVLQPNGLLVLGLPIESNFVNRVRRHRYFHYHPGHLYSFSLENIDVLLRKTCFKVLRFYFEPRIIPGRLWLETLQKMPSGMAHQAALAYWVVARRVDVPIDSEDGKSSSEGQIQIKGGA